MNRREPLYLDEPGLSAGTVMRRLAIPAYGPTLVFSVGLGAIMPVLPLSARGLGASVAVAALTVMLMDVASLLFNVPASVLTDRVGERRALVAAGVLAAVAALVCWVAPGLLGLCVGVFLLGMAHSVFMLARQTYLTEAVPRHLRARALSTLGGVMRIGMFAGPFVGAAVIHAWGLRAAYGVAVVSMLGAALLSSTMPDLPPHAARGRGSRVVTVSQVLRTHLRVFATVGVGVLLVSAVRTVRQVVVPLWGDQLELAPQTVSLVYGASAAVDMLLFYPAGRVMDLRGRRWVTVPSMVVMGVSLAALPLTTGAISLAVVAGLLGLGNGIGSGMIMTLGADFSPEVGRSQFLGIWRELSDVGAVGGPLLLSGVTAAAGLASALVVSGVIGLAAAGVMWVTVPRRRAGEHPLRT